MNPRRLMNHDKISPPGLLLSTKQIKALYTRAKVPQDRERFRVLPINMISVCAINAPSEPQEVDNDHLDSEYSEATIPRQAPPEFEGARQATQDEL